MQQSSRLKTAFTFVLAATMLLAVTAPSFAAIDFTIRMQQIVGNLENPNLAGGAGNNNGDLGFYGHALGLNAAMEPFQGVHALFAVYNTANGVRFGTGGATAKWANDFAITNLSPNFTVWTGDVSLQQTIQNYSLGPFVYGNPLITTSPFQMTPTAQGLGLNGSMNRVSWSFSIQKAPSDNSGWTFHPGVSVTITPSFSAALSYRMYSGEGNGSGTQNSISGSDGENVPNQGAGNPLGTSQVTFGPGTGSDDSHSYELGVNYTAQTMPLSAKLWYTAMSADVSNPAVGNSGDEAYSSYGLQGVYNFTPASHVAARYVIATNDSDNGSGAAPGANDSLDRISFGIGHQYNDMTKMRLEYVDQSVDAGANFGGAGGIGNVGEFDGFLADIHVKY